MRLLVIAALALSGCGPTYDPVEEVPIAALDPPSPPPPAMPGKCGNPAWVQSRYIGQRFTPALEAEIRRTGYAPQLRVIRPGDAVTMDYREDRLNIELDEGGRIRAVRCG